MKQQRDQFRPDFENNCGWFRNGVRTETLNTIYGRLKQLTGAHYHERAVEIYFVESGRGKIRLKPLDGTDVEERALEPGAEVMISPRTVHQVYSEEDVWVYVVSTPPWAQKDEIEVRESLFAGT